MSTSEKHPLNDLMALSMQLNRQAFAQPPIEGWLKSFLAMVLERYSNSGIAGVQVSQVIGNIAVQMASAGSVPAEMSEQHPLDEGSPISLALRSRQITPTAGHRIYPILRGDDAVGVLILYLSKPGDILGKTTDSIIGSLALQLGPALFQTVRPVGQQTGRLTRQVDMMRSLYEVTRTFSSALESVEVSSRAAHSLTEMLKVDHTSIYIFNHDEGRIIAEYPENKHVGTKLKLIGISFYEALVRDRRPIIIKNVDESTTFGVNKSIFQDLGVKAAVLLPMFIQDDLIGMVSLDVYYAAPTFPQEEIENAMAVTEQLAISVRNAELYDQIRSRATQLEMITELSRRVTSTFDRNRIFQIISEETQKLIDTSLISVALRQNDMLELYLLSDKDKDGAIPTPTSSDFLYEQTALRFVCNTAEPLVLDDISGSDYPDYKLLSEQGMRGAVIVPLVIGGQAIGTYNVTHVEAGIYSSLDLAVLEQIGQQLAIALENSRLYAQTVQRVEAEQLMNRLGGGMQGSGDLQAMLLSTVQEMAEALGAKRARIRLQMPSQAQENANAKLISASGKLLEKFSEKSTKP